ncbi:hypothetical protein [Actinoplanes sp. NPDC051494]|uniref:hypothetical protein n=1 Tax=Actinoplanes sp. NPDC051494 TaxID=3363907 RepID=UPI0037923A19
MWIEPPLHVASGSNLHLGDDVYVNLGLTVVDDVEVRVGSRVMIAPNVTVTATGHPVHPKLRRVVVAGVPARVIRAITDADRSSPTGRRVTCRRPRSRP